MATTNYQLKPIHIVQALAGALVVTSYFLPWVVWDSAVVRGMDMAAGKFFKISEQKFGVENPFPKLSFLFYAFWLLPILAAASAVLPFMNKRTVPLSYFAGALSLSLVTIFLLFSNTLIDLGAGSGLIKMLKPFIWIQAAAAILLILSTYDVKRPALKIFWLLIGPVIAFGSFKIGEKYVMGQTHDKTESVKTDYRISADSLIKEFVLNDTASNRKYLERTLEVFGKVAAVDVLPDSTGTVKFEDSTGSYAIFSFDKEKMEDLKKIQAGTAVTLKAVCSGSIYSEILGTTSISFKRSTLLNKK